MSRSSDRPLSMTVKPLTPRRTTCRKSAIGAGEPTATVIPSRTHPAASTSSIIRCRRSLPFTKTPLSCAIYAPEAGFGNGCGAEGKGEKKQGGGVPCGLRVQSRMAMAEATCAFPPLPDLCGRVAVLGGTAVDKTLLLVGLALRQVRHKGIVVCLDARRQKQTEVQFRLLLRGGASYLPLPTAGTIPDGIAQRVLSTVSHALNEQAGSPLLLLDSVLGDQGWG